MDDTDLQQRLNAIDAKLAAIVEEIALQKRRRGELEDLKDDLLRVGRDVYDTAVVELESIHDHLKTGDILHLGKKVLRNVNTISQSLEQLENVRDFVTDFGPVSRELFQDLLVRLDEMERKGYFAFAKELGAIADRVVTSFSPRDVQLLGENAVTILTTVRALTQPEMLEVLNRAVAVYRKLDIVVEKDLSLGALLREMNSPKGRRGLAFAVRFLSEMADHSARSGPAAN